MVQPKGNYSQISNYSVNKNTHTNNFIEYYTANNSAYDYNLCSFSTANSVAQANVMNIDGNNWICTYSLDQANVDPNTISFNPNIPTSTNCNNKTACAQGYVAGMISNLNSSQKSNIYNDGQSIFQNYPNYKKQWNAGFNNANASINSTYDFSNCLLTTGTIKQDGITYNSLGYDVENVNNDISWTCTNNLNNASNGSFNPNYPNYFYNNSVPCVQGYVTGMNSLGKNSNDIIQFLY